jgi:hypothetical protein
LWEVTASPLAAEVIQSMATPQIKLPHQFQEWALSRVAAEVVACAPHGELRNLTDIAFDFSHLSFIRPSGVVFLSNLIWWLNHNGTRVHFEGVSAPTAAILLLDDSGFFELHCGARLLASTSAGVAMRPLIRLAHQDSRLWLESDFVPWLAEQLNVSQTSIHGFKVCIAELFNNSKDHGKIDAGSIFVQHFPNEREVVISFSDFGVGIPHSVRDQGQDISDAESIIYAVRAGFAVKSKPWKIAGGLDYVLQTVVVRNGGQVSIYSGNAMVAFVRGASGIRPIPFPSRGFCPGTTIDLSLRTDTIENLPEETEDLQW